MTEKEAVENLDKLIECAGWRECNGDCGLCDVAVKREDALETFNIAERDVSLRIRKVPKQGKDTRYHCPACDDWIAEYQHFCDNCGQAIDWTWKFEKGRKDETDKR